MKSKKQRALDRIAAFGPHFRCPICETSLLLEEGRFVCDNDHTFDLAKQGSVYLFNGQPVNGYTKALFEARRDMIVEKKLYAPVHEWVASWIDRQQVDVLLDAGTGEGSQLTALLSHVSRPVHAVGIDLAKDGIQQASKQSSEAIWFVNDLAHTAFRDGTFDFIFNMLSPANYEEFARILRPGGVVCKIIPGAGYLRQIREALYESTDEHATYDNRQTVERFDASFERIEHHAWSYDVSLTETEWQSLVAMTPLTWENKHPLPYEPVITIELEALIGRAH